ncbi:type II toxin-antitoxin system RelE/ParE family toxin [Endozoicomonas sp. SESOKO3]|uniref:type II toxin-antitoxin system RelE/ParE family toxin n=1 Tax=Endozoicomonas sp. SESOKO3 TaxID=2828744 RepID=UPI0021498602|nr:type II toxin-antitoxin system RelE/ParE family toxin [Endozoicomonas sp. SESOKO3]
MKSRISKRAEDDFLNHIERLDRLNPDAAGKIAQSILATLEQIEAFPEAGHKERLYRKLPVAGTEYVVYYRISADVVDIARILHSKQLR